MKLAVVLVAVLSFLGVAKVYAGLPPEVIAAIINEAIKMGAPFRDSALGRLHGEIFGTGRAARSSDVILFNKSTRDFKLTSNSCTWGGWSSDLFPEHELPSHTSTVYGMESNGFMAGVTCKVRYDSPDGSYFELEVDNPYYGTNQLRNWYSSSKLRLTSTLGQGNNNQARWIIEDEDPTSYFHQLERIYVQTSHANQLRSWLG